MSKMSDKALLQLKSRIEAIADARYMPARELAGKLNLNISYLATVLAELRQRKLLPPRSVLFLPDLARYRQLDQLMAQNPTLEMAAAVKAIYGTDTPKARYKLRFLVDACRQDGLDMTHINRLNTAPTLSNSRRQTSQLRFVTIEQVDPAALASFISLCKLTGGRHAA